MKNIAELILPNDRRYTNEHIWVQRRDGALILGISDFAQDQLGEIMKRLRIQADLQLNSEEPLLSRHHLIGRTPAVQVRGGSIWRCTPGQVISEEEFVHLFTMLIREKLL